MNETTLKPLVSIAEVARVLNVEIPTVRTWVKEGKLAPSTYIRIGRTYRFDMDRVLGHLQQDFTSCAPTPADNTPVQLELDFGPNDDI